MMQSSYVPGCLKQVNGNARVVAHALQHGFRYSNAVCETAKGPGSFNFNPWDRYEIDAGYCIDAPDLLSAGSHWGHGTVSSSGMINVFSKEVFRE